MSQATAGEMTTKAVGRDQQDGKFTELSERGDQRAMTE